MNVSSFTSGAQLATVTIPQLLLARYTDRPTAAAYHFKQAGEWVGVSWRECAQKACRLAMALQEAGLAQGNRVAIMGDVSQEWLLADMATICAGGVTVGLYFTSSAQEVDYYLSDSEAAIIFVGDQSQLRTVLTTSRAADLKRIVVMDPAWTGERRTKGVVSFAEFLGEAPVDCQTFLVERAARMKATDLASIGYTSGTTGNPKGAMLTHLSLLAGAHVITRFSPHMRAAPHRVVVHLPMSHTVGRGQATMLPLLADCVPYFGTNSADFAQTIREVKPTYYMAPPRFYQKFAAQLLSIVHSSGPVQRGNYEMAMNIGRQALDDRQSGHQPNPFLTDLFATCRKHIFTPLLAEIGFDEMIIAFTSSAPMPSELMTLWQTWGLPMRECYGQTELVGANLVQMEDWPRAGNVGVRLDDPSWETAVLGDGEMITRGPGLFVGYWNKPAETASALRDGWLYTGDIVEVSQDGVFKLVDRKKEIINTSGGKSISPTQIENEIRQSTFISEAAVIGEGRKYLTALVEVDPTTTMEWATKRDSNVKCYADLAKSEIVIRLIEAEIAKANGRLARVEQIKAFRILPEELTLENGVMTPTRKKRRKQLVERYQSIIDTLYDDSEEMMIKAQVQ